jgi:hypothetical protein
MRKALRGALLAAQILCIGVAIVFGLYFTHGVSRLGGMSLHDDRAGTFAISVGGAILAFFLWKARRWRRA